MKAVLVYNPSSGRAMKLKDLKVHFSQAGIELVSTIAVSRNLRKNLKPYIARKDIIVAAYGGDGTLSSVADILVNTHTIFAPLAGGTLNHFTKDLGIAQNLDDALSVVAKAQPRQVDVAGINGDIFLNNSSIGLYPSTLRIRDEMERKAINKWLAAIIASSRALYRYQRYEVEINGERFKTSFIFVGNNDYHLEKQLIGGRTKLNQGILSVYSTQDISRFSIFRVLILVILGKTSAARELKIWKATKITVHTKKKSLVISRDGEHELMKTPLEYEIIPAGLQVIF